MIDSITFNSEDKTITVVLVDGSSKTYSDATTYLADHPEREPDVVAIGW
jgi:hypothetical protein